MNKNGFIYYLTNKDWTLNNHYDCVTLDKQYTANPDVTCSVIIEGDGVEINPTMDNAQLLDAAVEAKSMSEVNALLNQVKRTAESIAHLLEI